MHPFPHGYVTSIKKYLLPGPASRLRNVTIGTKRDEHGSLCAMTTHRHSRECRGTKNLIGKFKLDILSLRSFGAKLMFIYCCPANAGKFFQLAIHQQLNLTPIGSWQLINCFYAKLLGTTECVLAAVFSCQDATKRRMNHPLRPPIKPFKR